MKVAPWFHCDGFFVRQCRAWLAPLVLAGVLAGCAIPLSVDSTLDRVWTARQAELSRLSRWQATGRIGVVSGEEGWHASFQWGQEQASYRIDLIGPLGQGRVLIQGDSERVSIQTQDGQRREAPDPDTLITEALGIRLPVSGLRYWLRGLPEPGPVTGLQSDAEGRLSRLEQNGWIIDYADYAPAAAYQLPTRIVARRQDLSVKLVIERWTL